jgi:Fe-S cluster assembly ATP-binding protein
MALDSTILEIKDLQVSINENEILKNLNLKVNRGEIHAIMGPNGSGSTFQKFLQVTQLILSQTVISFQRLKYFRS